MLDTNIVPVGIADIQVSQSPAVLTTNLGSCIGVCLYSSQLKVGGMLHLMMAHVDEARHNGPIKLAKFANTGIPELIKCVKTFAKSNHVRLEAKIFGGAKVLKNVTSEIGRDNEVATRELLKTFNIPIIAAKTGGEKGYRIKFFLETGKVECQIFGQPIEEF